MKKRIFTLLCAGMLAGLFTLSAAAIQSPLPHQQQGDFYVVVNGDAVTFSDAVPKLKDGRSFLPFATVFEQLGFSDIRWNGPAQTVTASKDGTSISMTIGKKQISLTKNGQSSTIDTDVAPYIDPASNRTYIPLGLAADALGYNVGWDSTAGVVLIDDVDAILAKNTATYSLMDQLMEYSRSFSKKYPKVTGGYTMDITTSEVHQIPGYDSFTIENQILLDGSYSSLVRDNSAFQFDTDMLLSFGLSSPDSEIYESEMEGLPEAMALDLELRGDLKSGAFYLHSAALDQLLAQPGMTNMWYKFDLGTLYQEAGLDYNALISPALGLAQEGSFAQFLADSLRSTPPTLEMTARDSLELINYMLADSNFQKSGNSYVNRFDSDLLKGSFTLTTNGGKITGYAMELSLTDPALGTPVEISTQMKGQEMLMEMGLAQTIYGNRVSEDGVPGEEIPLGEMSMTFSMGGTYQASGDTPATQPPSGATVVDLAELMVSEPNDTEAAGLIGGADGPTAILVSPLT